MKGIAINNNKIYYGLAIIIYTLLLLIVAIYNGYLLITPDTGSYIKYAFDVQLPHDRSPFYSVFVGITSLWISLWGTVAVQALLVAFLLHTISYLLLENKKAAFMAVIITIAITDVSWIVAYAMPDVFTPILFLTTLLFIFTSSRWLLFFSGIIFFVAILIHNSHFLIALFFCCFVTVLLLCANHYRLYLKRALFLNVLVVGAIISMCSIHFVKHRGFVLSSGSHVFLMGKLCESGVLYEYLNENCDDLPYSLCKYKDKLPPTGWQFLWDYSGPLYKTGGWDSSATEYNHIIKNIFATPRYSWQFLKHAAQATIMQMQYVNISGTIPALNDKQATDKMVSMYLLRDKASYSSSIQNTKGIRLKGVNIYYKYAFIICLILLPLAIGTVQKNRRFQILLLSAAAMLLVNAFVTATFANVLDRLQYRVSWILPYCIIVVIIRHLQLIKPSNR
jgi:hypothetical protein